MLETLHGMEGETKAFSLTGSPAQSTSLTLPETILYTIHVCGKLKLGVLHALCSNQIKVKGSTLTLDIF